MEISRDQLIAIVLITLFNVVFLCYLCTAFLLFSVFIVALISAACCSEKNQKKVEKCLCCMLFPVKIIFSPMCLFRSLEWSRPVTPTSEPEVASPSIATSSS